MFEASRLARPVPSSRPPRSWTVRESGMFEFAALTWKEDPTTL
jgi:hypothetical protein